MNVIRSLVGVATVASGVKNIAEGNKDIGRFEVVGGALLFVPINGRPVQAKNANIKASTPIESALNNNQKQVALQNMSDLLNVRQRSLELAPEPAQSKINMAEGIGAARYEQATGRKVTRSTDPAVDFIDTKLGAFDLKGPLRRGEDGSKINITAQMRADLAKSIIKEANFSTDSKAVVVDTLGLSKAEVQTLKSIVSNGVKTKNQLFM